jgi:hypothetical protein
MPKALTFQLTEEGLREIVEAIKHDKRPEVQTGNGIAFVERRKTAERGCRVLSASQPTVYDWYHCWQSEGVEGLANHPKPGRPAKANNSYIAQLEEVLDQDPQDLGYAFSMWTPNGCSCISKRRAV